MTDRGTDDSGEGRPDSVAETDPDDADRGTPGSDRSPGRPRATTHDALATIGVDLFTEHGYANVSVEQVAAAGGVSRRTFFRYFETKADVVWGDFDAEVERLRATLADVDDDVPMMAALRIAVVDFNRVPPEGMAQHRARLRLILTEPDLIARSLLKFEGWRRAIAEFVGRRLCEDATAFGPQLLGEVALSTAIAAYRQWIPRRSADLATCIDAAFSAIDHLDLLDAERSAGLTARLTGTSRTDAAATDQGAAGSGPR
ncbi:mycofactocin system transcriptional regulator [Georgenia sp. Z1491]|uniref:mycofactocin system transcriptional regulator n=1 Tax=Georgenia sp. Z1491 TaxID=3416707 RepID=UPI003CF8D040